MLALQRLTHFRFAARLIPVFALGLFTASCGDSDSEALVGSVSLQLDRATVPLGGPVKLALQFVVSPTHQTLAEDYRVMVHFLDDNGDLMWAADHDPPTPTSQWQPGQTISYTHRARIPVYPYIGEAVVSVGLYSAGLGVLYLDAFSTFQFFELLSEHTAFLLMGIVALLGFAITLRARSLTIGVLSLLGGHLTPGLLFGQGGSPLELLGYLTMLFGVALALSAWAPRPFRPCGCRAAWGRPRVRVSSCRWPSSTP